MQLSGRTHLMYSVFSTSGLQQGLIPTLREFVQRFARQAPHIEQEAGTGDFASVLSIAASELGEQK